MQFALLRIVLAVANERSFMLALLVESTLNPLVYGLGLLVLVHDCFGDV